MLFHPASLIVSIQFIDALSMPLLLNRELVLALRELVLALGSAFHCGLLLRRAVERAQSQDKIRCVDTDDIALGK